MQKIYMLGFLFVTFLVCGLDVNAQSRSSTYNRKDKWGFGRLVITSSKSFVSFKLDVGRTGRRHSDYCTGELDGRAKWITANIAELNSDFRELDADGERIGCRLTFIFTGNTITIRESDCNDYHGVMCNFEGKYFRLAPKKPKTPTRKLTKTTIAV